jgi:hypothetical protein
MKFVALFLLFASMAFAQNELFTVENPKHLKYNESDALKWYAQSTAAVEQEYHIMNRLTPTFTLVLGAEKDRIYWENDQRIIVYLKDWDRTLFRQAVIAAAINLLNDTKNYQRIEKHLQDLDNAIIDVKDLRK